jgi:tRNA modification GTPase
MTDMETIYALSSGAGRAGVAVIRLSGPKALACLKAMVGKPPPLRHASLRKIKHPISGDLLDEGLVLLFAAPHSFTGEDMAELQIHGSRASIDATLAALQHFGLRPAEAGEFTLRAFRNGRIDLAQAEGLADLIDSETDQQRQQALGQFGGRLSQISERWRQSLLDIAAPLAAAVDFPDEEDIPAQIEARARPVIEILIADLEKYLRSAERGRLIREGFSIILLGRPNTGKSTLLNHLLGSDHAIVSPIPGTTRDMIEARLELAGMAVTLIDTAGLREKSKDPIEQEGMRRARDRAARADMKIIMLDASDTGGAEDQNLLGMAGPQDLIVWNKTDLAKPPQTPAGLALSLEAGSGLEALIGKIEAGVGQIAASEEAPILTRQRHIKAVKDTVLELKQSLEMLELQPDMAAENVRLAARSLARITGAIDVEEVLGEIFSSFCIGK